MKPEVIIQIEDLPKSLRVPPGLEDYMRAVRIGKALFIQCMVCAKQEKDMFTVNVGDMTLHLRRIHNAPPDLPFGNQREGEAEPPSDTKLSPKDVVRLARLHPPEDGECACCGEKNTLEVQVETEEGTFGFACLDCATWIKKENPDVEWLE